MHWNVKDVSGQRFGKLLVLRDIGTTPKREHVWLCRCDCGKEVNRVGSTLRSGKSISCGCASYTPEIIQKRSVAQRKVGSAFRRALSACQASARTRGLVFSLTSEDFLRITSQNCFYCGTEPAQDKKSLHENYRANGIDRVDNNVGYVLENCVPCCMPCNYMKRAQGQDEFFARVIRIAKLHGGAKFQLAV